jgi:hypothetical protein
MLDSGLPYVRILAGGRIMKESPEIPTTENTRGILVREVDGKTQVVLVDSDGREDDVVPVRMAERRRLAA